MQSGTRHCSDIASRVTSGSKYTIVCFRRSHISTEYVPLPSKRLSPDASPAMTSQDVDSPKITGLSARIIITDRVEVVETTIAPSTDGDECMSIQVISARATRILIAAARLAHCRHSPHQSIGPRFPAISVVFSCAYDFYSAHVISLSFVYSRIRFRLDILSGDLSARATARIFHP